MKRTTPLKAPPPPVWPAEIIEVPVFDVPNGCTCTWTVSRQAPGAACLMRLRYRHNGCPFRHVAAPGAVS